MLGVLGRGEWAQHCVVETIIISKARVVPLTASTLATLCTLLLAELFDGNKKARRSGEGTLDSGMMLDRCCPTGEPERKGPEKQNKKKPMQSG